MTATDRARRVGELAGAMRLARELIGHDRWTPDQLRAAQQRRLREVVAHAVTASRFYRERYAGLIEADYARLGLPLPLASDVLARAVVAMGNGIALERLAGPDRVPDGLLSTMAVAFLRGAAADQPAAERRS